MVRVVLLAIAALLAAQAGAAPVPLVDDSGRQVTLPQPPRRLVTLLPSLAETVCALDACERLVATDRYTGWPAQAAALPKAGGPDDPDIEQIARLQPDLVLLGAMSRARVRLDALGIRTFVVDAQSYGDIERSIRLVANVLGVGDRGREVAHALAEQVGRIAAGAHTALSPTVYFEVDSTPYAAGEASFLGELLVRLHARNIVPAAMGPFPKLNPEYVVTHNPDVILELGPPTVALEQRPGWNRIRAVREHRVCTFSGPLHDILSRPGPRVAEGMQALADCLARVAPR